MVNVLKATIYVYSKYSVIKEMSNPFLGAVVKTLPFWVSEYNYISQLVSSDGAQEKEIGMRNT